VLNLLFNVAGRRAEEEGPIVAEAPPPGVTPEHDRPRGRTDSPRRDESRPDGG
jgi:hypothetical protein